MNGFENCIKTFTEEIWYDDSTISILIMMVQLQKLLRFRQLGNISVFVVGNRLQAKHTYGHLYVYLHTVMACLNPNYYCYNLYYYY